jgi:hypothetical protein
MAPNKPMQRTRYRGPLMGNVEGILSEIATVSVGST